MTWLSSTTSPPGTSTGQPAQIAKDLRRHRGSGAHHVVLDFLATDLAEMHESLNRFAREVRPQVE
jgi:hypothetical protein